MCILSDSLRKARTGPPPEPRTRRVYSPATSLSAPPLSSDRTLSGCCPTPSRLPTAPRLPPGARHHYGWRRHARQQPRHPAEPNDAHWRRPGPGGGLLVRAPRCGAPERGFMKRVPEHGTFPERLPGFALLPLCIHGLCLVCFHPVAPSAAPAALYATPHATKHPSRSTVHTR